MNKLMDKFQIAIFIVCGVGAVLLIAGLITTNMPLKATGLAASATSWVMSWFKHCY